jgi:hypothetical protein
VQGFVHVPDPTVTHFDFLNSNPGTLRWRRLSLREEGWWLSCWAGCRESCRRMAAPRTTHRASLRCVALRVRYGVCVCVGGRFKPNVARCTSHVTRHTSHVIRHTSHVTRHTSHATRHTSHVTRHTSHVTRHTSHVIRHTSHVTRHTSHATRHTSHITRHTSHVIRRTQHITPPTSGREGRGGAQPSHAIVVHF